MCGKKILKLLADIGDGPLSPPWLKWICFKLRFWNKKDIAMKNDLIISNRIISSDFQ